MCVDEQSVRRTDVKRKALGQSEPETLVISHQLTSEPPLDQPTWHTDVSSSSADDNETFIARCSPTNVKSWENKIFMCETEWTEPETIFVGLVLTTRGWSGLLRVFKDVKTFRTSKDDLSITQTTEKRKSFNQSRKQTSHWPVWASVPTTTTVHQLTFSSVGTSVMRWVISCWSRHFKLNNRILLKVMGLVLVVLVVLVVLMVQRQTGEAAAACHSSRTTD